jgi:subtilisin family serine protease
MASKKKSVEQNSGDKKPTLSLGKPEKIESGMDPHLQHILLDRREGRKLDGELVSSLEDGTVQLDVIAKLKDPSIAVPGLNVGCVIGQIVTGTIDVESIEMVRHHSNVLSLKSATKLHADLDFSVAEINADPDALNTLPSPPNANRIDGTGTIVGIIDYGCDFVSQNFRHADGSTRLLALWDQSGGTNGLSPAPFGYGREFDSSMINAALQGSRPYTDLRYRPEASSHGTHVMDIAAGNGRATGNPGVAPGADLIFVHIAHGDVTDDDSFGNSKKLLEAVAYIFKLADELNKPCAINVSLGTHGGPHDGSTLAEQGIDHLLRESPSRALAISAGNSWERRSHSSGEILVGEEKSLGWNIRGGDRSVNELEVWYPGERQLDVSIISPDGSTLGPVSSGETVNINSNNSIVGRIIHRKSDPNNGDNHIDILLDPSLPSGVWRVLLKNAGTVDASFHSWIERDDQGQSEFVSSDDDRKSTIGSISCGELSIAVGSYLSGLPSRELSPFTAEGPTRDGKQKPEVSAPGQFLHPYWQQGIKAANSLSSGTVRMSGTSMASPHVAGLLALIMQASPIVLSAEELREILIKATRNTPPSALNKWDSRYGFGRVDALQCLRIIIPQQPVASDEGVDSINAVAANTTDARSGLPILFADLLRLAGESQSKVTFHLEIEPRNCRNQDQLEHLKASIS